MASTETIDWNARNKAYAEATAPVYGVRRIADGEILFSSTDGEVTREFAEMQGDDGYEIVRLVADDRGERPAPTLDDNAREKFELAVEDVSALRERLARYRRRTLILADATAAAIRDDRLFDAQRELDAAKETATATLRILEVLRRVEDGEL